MLKKGFLVSKAPIVFLVCLAVIMGVMAGEAFAKEKKKILILLFHSRQPSEENFMRVVEREYDVDWTEVTANRSKDKAREILEAINPGDYDLVYCYGTSVAQLGREIIADKKGMTAVFCNVYNPVSAKVVDSWERPGARIVGGSIIVPIDAQIKVLRQLRNVKRLGVVYNPDEKNGLIAWEEAEGAQSKFGYTAIPVHYKGPDDVEKAISILKDSNADAALLTACSSIIAKPEPLNNALAEIKIPSISSLTAVGKKGALLALGVDYGKLGAKVGEAAVRILKGEDARNMPTVRLEKFDLVVNLKTADKMGIKMPVRLLRTASEVVK